MLKAKNKEEFKVVKVSQDDKYYWNAYYLAYVPSFDSKYPYKVMDMKDGQPFSVKFCKEIEEGIEHDIKLCPDYLKSVGVEVEAEINLKVVSSN